MPEIPPAWHPDPTGNHDHRWWDGQRWTEHVADAGVAAVDPLPAAPSGGDQTASGATGGSAAAAGTSAGSGTGGEPAAGADGATGTDAAAAHGGDQAPWGGAARTDVAQGAWSSDAAPTGQPAQQPGQQPAWPGTEGPGGGAAAWPGQEQGQGWGSAGPAPTAGDPNRTPGLAIAALALGMLAIPSAMILIGGLFGLVAIILGAVAAGKAKRGETGGRGIAIGGIITGSLGLLIAIGLFIAVFAGIAGDIQQCIEETGDPERCQEELERDLMDRFG